MKSTHTQSATRWLFNILIILGLMFVFFSSNQNYAANAQSEMDANSKVQIIQDSQISATQSCPEHTIEQIFDLDGVTVNTCIPFSPDISNIAIETDIVQSASLVTLSPTHQELSIYIIPYGISPASSSLPEAIPGISEQYNADALSAYRDEHIEYPDKPVVKFFGREIQGNLFYKPDNWNNSDDLYQITALWISEAGNRVWMIRLEWRGVELGAIPLKIDEVESMLFESTSLDAPSLTLQLSENSPVFESPETESSTSDLPFPSWWSGDCNVNNHSGSYPIGASYRGVKACRASTTKIVNFGAGVSQYQWECPEYVKRYLFLAFGIHPYSAHGKDVVWNYSGTLLEKVTNGTHNKGPSVGDVISYNGPNPSYGHTSIVTSANIDSNGNGTITIADQNYNSTGNGIRTHSVSNWYVNSGDGVSGWLHIPSSSCALTSIPSGYNHCANEGGTCNFSGTANVVYGANSCYTAVRSFSGGTACNNDVFGDPISGVQKACYTNGSTGGGGTVNWNARYFRGHDHWWDTNNYNSQMCEKSFSSTMLDRNYGASAPCGNEYNDNWVAEYTATVNFASGNYVFQVENDDGLKIWLNNQNITDRGGSDSLSYVCPARYLNGNVPLRVILKEDGGDARVKILWSTNTSVCIEPGDFSKSNPSSNATGVSTNPTLSWGTSSNASKYYYCIDTSNNNSCDTGWQDVGTATSKALSGLTAGTTYYWQARANNAGGEKFANSSTWWSFTTQPNVPGTPSNFRHSGSTKSSVTIAWDDVSNETGYKIYKWNGWTSTFDYLASVGANATSFTETGLFCEYGYYYEVSAFNGNGESAHAGWVLAPTQSCAVTPADFNGDGKTDISIFRPSTGRWYVNGGSIWDLALGSPGDIPVPGDYNGDGTTDAAFFRPSTGRWYVNGSSIWGLAFGSPGDIPVPGDYNGDGTTDVAFFRPSTGRWYVNGGSIWDLAFGSPGDIPVPGDYNGDGTTDVAFFRPSTGRWYVNGGSIWDLALGSPGDIPVPGDYNGDGTTDAAIFRPSSGRWYVNGGSIWDLAFGAPGDTPVPGDYNGDGVTDAAIFRPSAGRWYVNGGSIWDLAFGAPGDYPLPAPDTNADGDPYQ